jgi:hypothetical protein
LSHKALAAKNTPSPAEEVLNLGEQCQSRAVRSLSGAFECIEVLEYRELCQPSATLLPLPGRRHNIAQLDRVDVQPMAFNTSVARRVLNSRIDPLPFSELLLVGHQSERHGVEPNQLTSLGHSGYARGLDMLRAGRRIRLAQDENAFFLYETDHTPPKIAG